MSIRIELIYSNVMYKVIIIDEEYKVNVIIDSEGFESVSIYKGEIFLEKTSEEYSTVLKTFYALNKEEL